MGMKKVPCVVADDLTKAEIKAFRLADNKIQEMSGWDFEALDFELEDLKIDFDGDMIDFGFGATNKIDPEDFFDDAGEKEKKKKTISVTCPDCGKTFEVEV